MGILRVIRVSECDIDLAGKSVAVTRFEENVVEGDPLICDAILHEKSPCGESPFRIHCREDGGVGE